MKCCIEKLNQCFAEFLSLKSVSRRRKKTDPKKKVNKNKDFCRDEMQIHSWMIKMMYRHLKMSFVIIFHLKKIMRSKQILKMAMSSATVI